MPTKLLDVDPLLDEEELAPDSKDTSGLTMIHYKDQYRLVRNCKALRHQAHTEFPGGVATWFEVALASRRR